VLRLIDRQTELLEFSAKARGIDAHYRRALTMLLAPGIRKAFDLSAEPSAVRERYGRTTYGQGCLLARRLVEAGAKFVNVYFAQFIGGCNGGWDTHGFGGKPIIRGRRLAVEHVLGMLAAGDSVETVLEGYPWLEREDMLACLAHARNRVGRG